MDFYETSMGRQFYTATLPRIASALQDIAKALRTPVPRFSLSRESADSFLARLYQGEYDFSDIPDTDEIARCSQEILAGQAAASIELPPEKWQQIDHIFSMISRRDMLYREQVFAAGFRAAFTMIAAGLPGAGIEDAV